VRARANERIRESKTVFVCVWRGDRDQGEKRLHVRTTARARECVRKRESARRRERAQKRRRYVCTRVRAQERECAQKRASAKEKALCVWHVENAFSFEKALCGHIRHVREKK